MSIRGLEVNLGIVSYVILKKNIIVQTEGDKSEGS